MSIAKETVKHIAQLSRVELTGEEIEYYSSQLATILNYIEKINQLDLENIPFEFNPHFQVNVYRKDKIQKFPNLEGLLRIVPEKESNFIKVPKVIE